MNKKIIILVLIVSFFTILNFSKIALADTGSSGGGGQAAISCSSFTLSGSTSNLLLNADEIFSDWTNIGTTARAPPQTGFIEGNMREYNTSSGELVKLDILSFDSEANAKNYLNSAQSSFQGTQVNICGISDAFSFENVSQYTFRGYIIKQGKYTIGIYGYANWSSLNRLLIAFSNKYATNTGSLTISGRLISGLTGTPVANDIIQYVEQNSGNNWVNIATTDINGYFTVSIPAPNSTRYARIFFNRLNELAPGEIDVTQKSSGTFNVVEDTRPDSCNRKNLTFSTTIMNFGDMRIWPTVQFYAYVTPDKTDYDWGTSNGYRFVYRILQYDNCCPSSIQDPYGCEGLMGGGLFSYGTERWGIPGEKFKININKQDSNYHEETIASVYPLLSTNDFINNKKFIIKYDQNSNNVSTSVCGDGVCDSIENSTICNADCPIGPTLRCTDSDGGINYNVKGTTTGPYYWHGQFDYSVTNVTDYCESNTDVNSYLVENFCDANGSRNWIRYQCPNGCVDGACLASPKCVASASFGGNSCTDNDGGKNYFVKGYSHVSFATGVSFDRQDTCNPSGLNSNVLREWCCLSSGTDNFEDYNCPNGCKDGACINNSISTCGDGVCDSSEVSMTGLGQITSCPQDCGYEIEPYDADVKYCKDDSGNSIPTIGSKGGPQTVSWFIWNGCAKEKYYSVTKGDNLRFHVYTDTCSGCVCYYPNFDVYEYQNGVWTFSKSFSLSSVKGLNQNTYYTTNSDKIKIVARGCFYLDVFSSPTPRPIPVIPITEEYKTVGLGETFSISAEATSPYKWQLKNYDSNYLEQQTNVGGTCGIGSGQTNPTCTYIFSFKTINSGRTTIELDKINSNDNSIAEIKYIYVTINPSETKIAYLNQPFNLNKGGSAEIIDYRNMIVTLSDIEPLTTACSVTTTTTGGGGCAGGGWVATVSMSMPGNLVGISMNINLGESKDTPFGVKISFDRIGGSNTGVFTVYQETNEFNFYVKTDKYSYSPGESVRISAVLSGYPYSTNFNDAAITTTVTDPEGRLYNIRMNSIGTSSPACTQSVATGTYTCAIINEYYFIGTFNTPSSAPSGVYNVMSTAILSGIKKNADTSFEVGRAHQDFVDVSISPKEQHAVIGNEITYQVTVTDKHPVPLCPITTEGVSCTRPTYNYYISVNGLPYNTKYQNIIGLPAGGSMTFNLLIFPSSTGTTEGVTTATTTVGTINPASSEERIVSIVTGGAIATTPVAVQQAQATKEIMFKFTVQATQQDDSTVSDSDGAILYVRYIETPQPPPFPQTESVDIELRNGWNLVSAPGYGYFSLGTCSMDSKPVAFIYLTDQKRYVSFDEATNIMGTDKLKEYLSTNSFWIYLNESCKITFNVEKYSTYSGLQLNQGWNLLGISKDMVGETISNIKGTCTFEKLYSWDADSQKWTAKTENDLIDKMGYGIIAEVASTCNLEANVIQPPTVPG